MINADSKPEIGAKRKAFIRKWRLKCRAVAVSLEEAGDKLFTFARFPKSQWKSIRTSNAIEVAIRRRPRALQLGYFSVPGASDCLCGS